MSPSILIPSLIILCVCHIHAEILPVLHVRGTNYEVGYQVGETFKERIQFFLGQHRELQDTVLPALTTVRGRHMYDTYLAKSLQTLPEFVDEIKGIADGAQINFETVFAVHLVNEFGCEARSIITDGGCTDLMLKTYVGNEGSKMGFMAHTEDVPPEIADGGYILDVEITGSEHLTEKFIAYAYPGMLPGNAFGVNKHGLVHIGNNIRKNHLFVEGMLPRRLVLRALMRSENIPGAINIARNLPPMDSAFTYNMGQRVCADLSDVKCLHLTSLEFTGAPSGTVLDVHHVDGFYFHTNHFIKLDIDQHITESSKERMKRVAEIEKTNPPRSLEDLLDILSDTNNEDLPIYRTGQNPDYGATAVTAGIDFQRQVMEVYRGKPAESRPIAVFSINFDDGNSNTLLTHKDEL